jgi:hydroxymethylglutaryl-CoA reductase (NADPH)
MKIPSLILKQMYTVGSLENAADGVRFSLKNRLSNATLTRLTEVRIDGQAVPLERLTLEMDGDRVPGSAIGPTKAMAFPLAKVVRVHAQTDQLPKGRNRCLAQPPAQPPKLPAEWCRVVL